MGANNQERVCESALALELLVVDSHQVDGLRLVEEFVGLSEVEQANFALPDRLLREASSLQANALLYRVGSSQQVSLRASEQLVVLLAQRQLMTVLSIDRERKDLGDWIRLGFDQVCFLEQADAAPNAVQLLPHFEAARVQFGAKRELSARVDCAEGELADKTLIRQATAQLVGDHQLSEQAAYRRLQRHSMDTNLKLTDVARRVVAQSSAMSMATEGVGTKNG